MPDDIITFLGTNCKIEGPLQIFFNEYPEPFYGFSSPSSSFHLKLKKENTILCIT